MFSFDGRLVRKFAGKFPAGEHRWIWDGKDEEGQVVASGVYTVRMEAGDFRTSEKVALVKVICYPNKKGGVQALPFFHFLYLGLKTYMPRKGKFGSACVFPLCFPPSG